MTLEKQLVDIIKQIHDEKRLGDKRAEQFYNAIGANTTHRSSVGTDHGYINQNVTTTGKPQFAGFKVSQAGEVNIGLFSDSNVLFYFYAGAFGSHTAEWSIGRLDADNSFRISEFGVGYPFYLIPGGGIFMPNIKSGATQGAAGAAAGELWRDTADNSVKLGV